MVLHMSVMHTFLSHILDSNVIAFSHLSSDLDNTSVQIHRTKVPGAQNPRFDTWSLTIYRNICRCSTGLIIQADWMKLCMDSEPRYSCMSEFYILAVKVKFVWTNADNVHENPICPSFYQGIPIFTEIEIYLSIYLILTMDGIP